MKVDLITLCDAAVDVNGRLHVLGTIDFFWAGSVPYVHPKCTLAVRIRVDTGDSNRKHRLRVHVLDADANAIAETFEHKLGVVSQAHDDVPMVRHLVIDLKELCFENYGPYAVLVEANGQELASLPFSVVPPSQIPAGFF